MFAIISDIHANLEAFRAVLADIDAQGAERIVCLGDVVGYGPDPGPCLTLARTRCDFSLQGNHDLAILGQALGFNPAARAAIDWAREKIRPRLFSGSEKRANWKFLQEAPLRREESGMLFVHASPRDPVTEYIDASDTGDADFGPSEKIQEIMAMISGICFVGHTHRPGVIDAEYVFRGPAELPNGWPVDQVPAVVNVGSVGQPRDHDPRACYVIVDDERIRYRRVEYDIDTVVKKLEQLPEIDKRLSARLRNGT